MPVNPLRRTSRFFDRYFFRARARPLFFLLLVLLVLTTLPHPFLSLAACLCATVTALLLFVSSPRYLGHPLIWMMAGLSVLSGCGGPLAGKAWLPELTGLCGDQPCRSSRVQGWGVLGVTLGEISVAAAQKAGGIQTVRGIEAERGFGLVTRHRITVYGD